MSLPDVLDLDVIQGKTFSEVLRWEQPTITMKKFDASASNVPIVQLAPLRLKVTGHGMPDGWAFHITNVEGMVQLNSSPTSADPNRRLGFVARKIDADVIEVLELILDGADIIQREVNAAGFSAYTGGGYIEYALPVDLSTVTAWKWQARKAYDSADPAVFDLSTTLNANGSGIVADNTAKTVTLQLGLLDTAAFAIETLVHEVEVIVAGGTKPPFVAGLLRVRPEVVK